MRWPKLRFENCNEEEDEMKRSLWVVGVAAALMVAWSIGWVQGQQAGGKVIFASADQASFTATPGGGPSMAAIWGDANQGAHGTFTKFAPGFDAGCTPTRTMSGSSA
jgi:hypothetical protein